MPRIFSLTLRLIVFLTLAMAGVMRADTYDHSGHDGSLMDGMWLNQTTTPPGGPNVYGNPGVGDKAIFYGSTITASGGSVDLLSGGSLSLSGDLTAVNVGELNSLSGSGTLNIQAIVLDPAGFTGVTVVGGHLNAQNGDGVSNVTAGGTVVDQTCSGKNGCGSFDGGSSLTITGAGGPGERAIFSNASTFTANAGLTSFTLQLASGSTAHVSTMTDALIRIDGAGSILTASGDCSLNSQSMNISHGGAATLNGNLTQSTVGPIHVNDSGTSLTIGGKFLMTGGGLQINGGGTVRAGSLTQTRGSDSFDGANSTLTVDQELTLNAAFFDISGGAAVTVNGQFVLDGGKDVDGNDIGGGGHWQGMGTMIASNGTMFIGDHNSGGFSLSVNNSATVQTGEVEIGSNSSSVGQVGLSGAGTLWEVRTGGLGVGQGGSGTFNISNSGRLLFDSGTFFGVGLNAGSTGRMTIDGSGSSVDATSALLSVGVEAGGTGNIVLTDQASLSLGQNTFIGDGGNGSLSIGSGCHVTLTGNANTNFGVANQPGSTGGISIQDGGNLNVDALFIVGVGGNGFVGVGNGGMIQSIAVSLGAGSGAVGNVVVDGAGSIWNSSGNVFIGYANEGSGKWTVSSGGALNIIGSDPKFGLGESTGTTGELDVDGSGSQVTAPRFISGVSGTGTMNVTNGGLLQTGSAVIGAARSSIGHVLVTDAGSQWTVTTNGIYIAGLVTSGGFSQGGPGTLTVGTGGLVLVPRVIGIGRLGNIILNGGAVGIGTNANPAANTLRVAANGILTGSGRVQGQVIVAQGGRVLPGNSPGILTIDGDYEQDAGATYSVEIGGPDPASGYDQINATGTATLAGNLNVRLTDGFTPQVGQTFRIISASSVSGAFSSISGPSQAGINLTSDSSGVTATITSVVDGAPVISGATTAGAAPGTPFSYQITATNSPTSFGATDLPDGLTVDHTTGIISGTPTTTGTFIVPMNANNAAGSGQADLVIISEPDFGVAALPPANLLNISTRLNVQTGDNVLIGGFIITGTDPKKVVIRGIGPSLANFGVQGFLADPILELHDASTTLETNDNWKTKSDGSSQQAEIEATTVPPTNDLESAIVRTLPANNASYTAVVRGKDNSTGLGVVEAYDLDQAANSKLGNISTRGFVNSGDNVLIGGFITGSGAARVMVRAIGPSLANFGVTNPLQDPTLELHDGNGVTIRSNDNWKTREDNTSQQSEIEATTIAPTNDLESALVQTLSPGNYTAVVRGKNNTTGTAVVEVYALQ